VKHEKVPLIWVRGRVGVGKLFSFE